MNFKIWAVIWFMIKCNSRVGSMFPRFVLGERVRVSLGQIWLMYNYMNLVLEALLCYMLRQHLSATYEF